MFGSSLEAELNAVEAKTAKETKSKQQQILRKWIPEAAAARKFADPAKRELT